MGMLALLVLSLLHRLRCKESMLVSSLVFLPFSPVLNFFTYCCLIFLSPQSTICLTLPQGPMWREIRGQGLAYSSNLYLNPAQGLLILKLLRASQLTRAYKEALNILVSPLHASLTPWGLGYLSRWMYCAMCSLVCQDAEWTFRSVLCASEGVTSGCTYHPQFHKIKEGKIQEKALETETLKLTITRKWQTETTM